VVHIKFFTPDSNWTWYVTEGSAEGIDRFFDPQAGGLICGYENYLKLKIPSVGYRKVRTPNLPREMACSMSKIFRES
jgi:hypothetical protein